MSQRGLPQRREIVSSLILSPFSPPLHYWKGHAARHSGRLPVVQLEGGGYRGLMRWRIPTECLHRQILIKNSSVSSFVSSSALWPFFLFISFFAEILSALIRHFFHFCFSCQGKNGPMWFRCSSSGEWGGGEYGYLLPGWDLLLNWLLAQKWRNWKDNLVMQVCR